MFKTCPGKLCLFVFVCIFFFFSSSCFSQQLVYKFKQFTSNDGLPSSEVHQVLRDSRNFMWFATDHGVCRYDGYSFQIFDLPDNSILELYEDSKKRIWAVSFSGQLFYYEDGKFSDYKYNDIIVKQINQITINRIYVDSVDNVYVTTTLPNCFVITQAGEFKRLFHDSYNWNYEAFEMRKGIFFSYIASTPQAYLTDKQLDNTLKDFTVTIHEFSKSVKFEIPYSQGRKNGVIRLRDSSLIFYAGRFFFRISKNGTVSSKKFENDILDIKEYDDQKLFIATIQTGLYVLDKKNNIIENHFPGLTITSVEKDYEGGLWVSTTQAGVFYLNSLQMQHLAINNSIIDDKILCLDIAKKSQLWIGEENGSMLFFDIGKRITQYNFPVISINKIYSDVIPDKIIVCVGSYIKVNNRRILKQNAGKRFIFYEGATDLIQVNGKFISGAQDGISEINFSSEKRKIESKSIFRTSCLFYTSEHTILAGNLFGLWRYLDGQLYPYDTTKKILSSRVTAIDEYKKNTLLVGTRGKGFLIVSKDTLLQLTKANGLASDNIRKIFVDDSIIWIATNLGISRLTIESINPFRYSIENITVQDGLLSNEVNDIKRLDEKMIVATNDGISFFDRKLYEEKGQLPVSLYVTGVKVNGFDTTISSHYDLYRSSRNFSISFVGLSYRKNANVEYRYRLLGIDSNWVNSTAREIQFNPIPYGKYIVQVESRRQGEEWDDYNMISVSINCEAPFWKTTWFWILSFLIAAFIMMLFFVNRTKKIKAREKERTSLNKKLAEMELKALRAQMNPHFIFNILNSIQYYITHNENDAAQRYMSKFAKLVRLTLDNSRSTFILLSDELLLLKLYIDLEKIRFEDRFDYKINIADNININSIKIPNMLLQPYVENSIKHGFKSKQTKYFLDISVLKQNKNILCTIIDNGVGRAKAAMVPDSELDKHTSTGTIIVNEKIEALKFYYNYDLSSRTEDLRDDNGNPIGTKVILEFPENADLSDKI